MRDNRERSRFELDEAGQIVFANYRRQNSTLVIPYVEAPPALRGTGASGRLMEGIMGIARAEGLKIVPLCGFASAWMRRHKQHRPPRIGIAGLPSREWRQRVKLIR